MAAGMADRWSDVDLRLAVEEADVRAVTDEIPATLAAVRPVLGSFGRPVRGGRLVVFTFEGPLRADVEIATPAALRGLRHEAVAPLIDTNGRVARFADEPLAPRQLTPEELIEREAGRVPVELGRLQQAIEKRSILAAVQAQATLLDSAQRPAPAGARPARRGPRGTQARGGRADGRRRRAPLLDPLPAWSPAWPDPGG